MFDGFDTRRVTTGGTEIHCRVGGAGPPLVLLHGYPQTHVMWHRVAPGLAEAFTVIAPDLRGYGDSGKPTGGAEAYTKRVMAQDVVEVAAALGFERFRLTGHDRGARVAYRLALDHPARVERLALLDIAPTLETFEAMDRRGALGSFHWYFLAQPSPLPERMIGADAEGWLRYLLERWRGPGDEFDAEAVAEYARCFRDPETVRATCDDYRAGATLDCEHDAEARDAGTKITCPLLVLWGAGRRAGARSAEILDVWRRWATDVRGQGLPCGHFLPEEAPTETLAELRAFFAEPAGAG